MAFHYDLQRKVTMVKTFVLSEDEVTRRLCDIMLQPERHERLTRRVARLKSVLKRKNQRRLIPCITAASAGIECGHARRLLITRSLLCYSVPEYLVSAVDNSS